MDLKNMLGGLKLAGTLLAAGAAYGSISARVSALEQRKDYSADVVTAQVQITGLTNDMHDVKIKLDKILERLPK